MLLFSLATFWLLFVSKLINWEHTIEHNCPSFRRTTSNMTICHPNWNVLLVGRFLSEGVCPPCLKVRFVLYGTYNSCFEIFILNAFLSCSHEWWHLWSWLDTACGLPGGKAVAWRHVFGPYSLGSRHRLPSYPYFSFWKCILTCYRWYLNHILAIVVT